MAHPSRIDPTNNRNDNDNNNPDSLPFTQSSASYSQTAQEVLGHALDDDGVFSEAEEVGVADELIEDDVRQMDEDEEEDGEDLFGDQAERDYIEQPHLDRYDADILDDDTEHAPMTVRARRRAERELADRDRSAGDVVGDTTRPRQGAASRYYAGLEELLAEDDGDEDEERRRRLRERKTKFRQAAVQASKPLPRQAEQARDELPQCNTKTEWTSRIEEIIKLILQGFIWHYRRPAANGEASGEVGLHIDKIGALVREEATSMNVAWQNLADYSANLCDWLTLHPTPVLELFDSVVTEITQSIFPSLYKGTRVCIRLMGFHGFEALRNLRTDCLNQLVAVEGVCIRRTNVSPQMKLYYLECQKCGCDANGPYEKKNDIPTQIRRKCQDCQSNGPFFPSRENTVYENYQTITVQEPPGSVKAGHMPQQRKVIVVGDLVDTVRPGDEIVVTGIYQTHPASILNAKSGFPIFDTQIVANNVQRKGDLKMEGLTDDDIDIIKKLSKNKLIREKIIDSVAPAIWGHRHVKTAIAYAMFGGVERTTSTEHRIRGDINVLILGDPGMGKSQFLKYVEKAFERTVFTTGKGASAAGLTAAVKRDPTSGEWSLEGGALVIADEGICLIDEFDKMSDKDRVSIHEAMEQQSISISKAGLVATLRARCSIIAAANPIFGRYDSSLSFSENVDLSDPMLSRFDVLAVLKDEANPLHDEYLADYVVTSHMRSHPDADKFRLADVSQVVVRRRQINRASNLANNDDGDDDWLTRPGPIPHEVLKKYIFYARRHYSPDIHSVDHNKLIEFYSSIRQAAINSGGIPMTVRHLESMIRTATANAKMRLSHFVEKRDFDFAIATMLESFIQSQKFAVSVNLSRKFGRYRALASSPFEFIESILIDILSRKGKQIYAQMRQKRLQQTAPNLRGDDGILNDDILIESQADAGGTSPSRLRDTHHLSDGEASWSELSAVSKHLYNIPDTAIQQYVQTARFRSKFLLRREATDWVITQIRSEFDISSQGSQE